MLIYLIIIIAPSEVFFRAEHKLWRCNAGQVSIRSSVTVLYSREMHALFSHRQGGPAAHQRGSNGACYICVASLNHLTYLAVQKGI